MTAAAAAQVEPTKPSGAQLGNENGHRGAVVRDALRKYIAKQGKGDFEKGLTPIIKKTYELAKEGEQWAVQEIFNRLAGRVPAAVEVTGANGGDLVIRDQNTAMGVARRVAFVLAHGALAKANGAWGEAKLMNGGNAETKGS